jgi:hypothetical protein
MMQYINLAHIQRIIINKNLTPDILLHKINKLYYLRTQYV